MAACYIVAQIKIEDRAEYAMYEAGFVEIFDAYGGTALSVDEAPTVLEGEWPWTRTVLLRFASREQALAWYESDEYQALAQHRFAASSANVAVIRGF